MNYKYYDEKYANFLLKKCLVNDDARPLAIMYKGKALEPFALVCLWQARKLGFKKIYLYNTSEREQMEYLYHTELCDIKKESFLDVSELESCARENGNFLSIETYELPFYGNVSCEKRKRANVIINQQLTYYPDNLNYLKCPWTAAAYPSKDWAKKVYPSLPLEKAYEKLYFNIMDMCFMYKENPVKEWESIGNKFLNMQERLNQLEITKLHYSNQLGTDLDVYLPDKHVWTSGFVSDYFGNPCIVNMPSYEIFTSPVFSKTEGIVFSTKPLNLYGTNGYIVDSFGLEFKKGKVVRIFSRNDEDYKQISALIHVDDHSSFLGECAIVERVAAAKLKDTLYYHALLDEQASCHLALGFGYPDTIRGGLDMTRDELSRNGMNLSSIHIDFMIGTDDLEIEADTKNGKQLIYKDGRCTF